jgi:hypothetical protein
VKMMIYKKWFVRRKDVTNIYITTRVIKKDRSTKNLEKIQIKLWAKQMSRVYTDLYQKLDTKQNKNNVYKLTKSQEKKTREFNQFKCIMNAVDMFLVKNDEIKDKWREYFDKLYNDKSENIIIELATKYNLFREFKSLRWKNFKRIKIGRTLDDIPIEICRCLEDVVIVWLIKLFNIFFDQLRCLMSEKSILVLIFKNKEDIQSCTN